MLLTLDESGKDGLKPLPGRSPWLVIGGPLFPTRDAAHACRAALEGLRAAHGSREFHFTKDDDTRRRAVLTCLSKQEFTFHAAVCDRSALGERRWRHAKAEDLYFALATHLMVTLRPLLTDCTLWFDTLGGDASNKRYRSLLVKAADRGTGGRSRIKDCGVRKSEKELTVQVADYMCGAIARSLHPIEPDRSYRQMIRRREGRVVEWVETAVVVQTAASNEGGEEPSPPASSQ